MIEIPTEGRSRETKIRRDARGRWWNDGVEITHVALCRAFDAWIDRADDGRYCLKNDINWAYVAIEGAPLFVRALQVAQDDAEPTVTLVLSDGRETPLVYETLREGPDGALYADVRGGSMACAFTDAAMMSLAPYLDEDGRGVYLALGSRQVRPARATDPLVPFCGAVVERRLA